METLRPLRIKGLSWNLRRGNAERRCASEKATTKSRSWDLTKLERFAKMVEQAICADPAACV